ncbi:restriction endonuclease subunit S [Levilactobacillus namurensis]|uniref:restriction endonuclease subunit S n=1 Tax=Levilactobacillus namurensis TaxID=380393 RepID=UPI001DD7B366|nr:restriction endonuclease subunit S [Levilactobacillus namurensis]HJE45466.1 restriction endonuclease subunit S [Levilactobacillus namurensis]
MSKKLTPNVRFKGFSDDWEQRKLEQVVSNLRSYSLSRKVESSYPTHTKYIHYGDIHTRRAAKITSLSQLPDIIDGDYDYISYGDIAVADASEDYKDIAIPTILLSEDKNYSVVSGLHTIAFRPDKRMNPLFLYYLLFTQDFKHFVYREGQGLKVFGITRDNLFKYPISYPIKDEQNQVVQVFESLVSTIASNQKQLDQLKTLKKLFLQKIFDQEWRFKGFTDPWEQRKLKEMFTETKRYVNPGLENIPLFSVTVANGLVPKSNRYNRQFLVKKKDKFKLVKPDEFIYNPMNITIGAVGFNSAKLNVAVSGYYVTMSLNPNFDKSFMQAWINSPIAIKKYKLNATGSLLEKQRVQFPIFSNIKISIPVYEEQESIGIILKSLGDHIASNQRKGKSSNKGGIPTYNLNLMETTQSINYRVNQNPQLTNNYSKINVLIILVPP